MRTYLPRKKPPKIAWPFTHKGKRVSAFHEAGHVLAAYRRGLWVQYATIAGRRGRANHMEPMLLRSRIACAMAGLAAESILLGLRWCVFWRDGNQYRMWVTEDTTVAVEAARRSRKNLGFLGIRAIYRSERAWLKRNFWAVEVVAKLLLKKRRITQRDLVKALGQNGASRSKRP